MFERGATANNGQLGEPARLARHPPSRTNILSRLDTTKQSSLRHAKSKCARIASPMLLHIPWRTKFIQRGRTISASLTVRRMDSETLCLALRESTRRNKK